jgi:hypothetical protein
MGQRTAAVHVFCTGGSRLPAGWRNSASMVHRRVITEKKDPWSGLGIKRALVSRRLARRTHAYSPLINEHATCQA